MGIRKNQIVKLSHNALGHRRLTNEEYNEVYEKVRDRITNGGTTPFIDCVGETVIVGHNHCEELGGAEVKVIEGRAKWDLDYTWRIPTNLMRVAYKGHHYLVSRKSVTS